MTTRPRARPPSRTRSTKVAPAESDTRDSIVRAALGLFAKRGIDGVSLRQIVMAAGQANPSAVHYHFQSKEGLICAVIDHVNEQLEPLQQQSFGLLKAAEARGGLTVREVVRLAVLPFANLYAASYDGRMAIRFLSRLTWQRDVSGQDRLFDQAWSFWREVVQVLQPLIPQKSIETLTFQGVITGCTLLHGLADMSLLSRQPTFGLDDLLKRRSSDMFECFCDYLAGGLSGPTRQEFAVAA